MFYNKYSLLHFIKTQKKTLLSYTLDFGLGFPLLQLSNISVVTQVNSLGDALQLGELLHIYIKRGKTVYAWWYCAGKIIYVFIQYCYQISEFHKYMHIKEEVAGYLKI